MTPDHLKPAPLDFQGGERTLKVALTPGSGDKSPTSPVSPTSPSGYYTPPSDEVHTKHNSVFPIADDQAIAAECSHDIQHSASPFEPILLVTVVDGQDEPEPLHQLDLNREPEVEGYDVRPNLSHSYGTVDPEGDTPDSSGSSSGTTPEERPLPAVPNPTPRAEYAKIFEYSKPLPNPYPTADEPSRSYVKFDPRYQDDPPRGSGIWSNESSLEAIHEGEHRSEDGHGDVKAGLTATERLPAAAERPIEWKPSAPENAKAHEANAPRATHRIDTDVDRHKGQFTGSPKDMRAAELQTGPSDLETSGAVGNEAAVETKDISAAVIPPNEVTRQNPKSTDHTKHKNGSLPSKEESLFRRLFRKLKL